MKKLIFLLTIITLSYSCSSDSNSNNNNSNGNVDYEFAININGVVHKVKGNTSDFITEYGGNQDSANPNTCRAIVGTSTILQFMIADITKSNFVSGPTLLVTISIPNCQLGQNEALMNIQVSPAYDSFLNSISTSGIFVENSGFYCSINTSSCQFPRISDFSSRITLNITDLGTPTVVNQIPQNGNYINYGNTFKGSFNGIVYFSTPIIGNAPINFNIPMQLSVDFKAYRLN